MQRGSRRLMKWVSQRNPINPVTTVGRVITQPHNVNLEMPHAINAKRKGILLLSANQERLIQIMKEGGQMLDKEIELNGLTVMQTLSKMSTLTYQYDESATRHHIQLQWNYRSIRKTC